MTRIAVTGHASLDHVAMLDGSPKAGCTTTILRRPRDAWPRLGGSPAYVAAALVAAGLPDAFPVSWIGDDPEGKNYRAQLARNAIPDDGVAIIDRMRTPVAVLAYEPDGGCICLYDPSSTEGVTLSQGQRQLLSGSDWVCVTIGPRSSTEAALGCIGDDSCLAWIVKHDPRSMPVALAARIAARADLIFASRAERTFLREAMAQESDTRPERIVIETQGGSGALVSRYDKEVFVEASPMDVSDPTGAGDTFAGGVLAALVKGERDPTEIVRAGHRAARAMLAARRDTQMESDAL
ncbi:MAG: carbohydrate kinase family protein [Rhizobiaceae bacterium]